MEIVESYKGGYHKILKIAISAGQSMEEHYATTDAFIIVLEGKAKLIFKNRKIDLMAESVFLIPALKAHLLNVTEDLKAYLVLGSMGNIEPIKNFPKNLDRMTND